MMEKKPFKETKLGHWLTDKAPHVLDTVGDLMPDSGVLGVVKRAIDKIDGLTVQEKFDFAKMHSEQLKEVHRLEISDLASARAREVGVANSGRHDFLMYVTGLIILSAFALVLYANIFLKITGEGFVRIETMVETLTVGLASYYFGYSKSQSDKSKL